MIKRVGLKISREVYFSKFIFIIFNHVYVFVSVCGYVHVSLDAWRSQRRPIPLELELQVVGSCSACVPGAQLWSFFKSSPHSWLLNQLPGGKFYSCALSTCFCDICVMSSCDYMCS